MKSVIAIAMSMALLAPSAAEAGHQTDDDLSRGPHSPAPPTPPASGLERRPRVGLIVPGFAARETLTDVRMIAFEAALETLRAISTSFQ
jgi:hypothetical protein